MNNKKKQMMAPLIITVIVVLYYLLYFGLVIEVVEGIWKFAFGIIPIGLSLATIKVCLDRIHEIKEGEEDDLSKY